MATSAVEAAIAELRALRQALPGTTSVAVGLSGGVDSSVSAYLLQEAGFAVRGIFMANWSRADEAERGEPCPIEQDWVDVKKLASMLRIPVERVDFSQRYWTHVFEPFVSQYESVRGWQGR
jgi:tRNA-specific 2-thiouridylase